MVCQRSFSWPLVSLHGCGVQIVVWKNHLRDEILHLSSWDARIAVREAGVDQSSAPWLVFVGLHSLGKAAAGLGGWELLTAWAFGSLWLSLPGRAAGSCSPLLGRSESFGFHFQERLLAAAPLRLAVFLCALAGRRRAL